MLATPQQYLAALSELEQGPVHSEPAARLTSLFTQAYDYPAHKTGVITRYRQLLQECRERFSAAPVLLARAPGRINLIGEHIDYNGCPVLPVAIDRDLIAIALPHQDNREQKARVVLINLDRQFARREFVITRQIQPYPTGDWGNYGKAAVQCLLDYYREQGTAAGAFRGFTAVLSGNIPCSAGLSSSSALVVLCALLFLEANHKQVDRLLLAGLLAAGEQYVGTAGGGMDQAICLTGKAGCAVKTGFAPLSVLPVALPPAYRIVAAHSTVTAAKTGNARLAFNTRAAECRVAAAIMQAGLKSRFGPGYTLAALGKLINREYGITAENIRALAAAVFHKEPYSRQEAAEILGLPEQAMEAKYFRDCFPAPGLKLYQRVQHVLTEWRRVEAFCSCLETGAYGSLGALLNRSHRSLSWDFEVSCPELDRLTAAARAGGAAGARLTGAGFGGYTVSWVEAGKTESFMEYVCRHYYGEYLGLDAGACSGYIFPCKPVDGAWVVGGSEMHNSSL